jgi:hypothetical protein
MNERIKELEKQCWSHRVNGRLVDGQLHFDTQKFAELIVRECAEVVYSRSGHATPQDLYEHFGVDV